MDDKEFLTGWLIESDRLLGKDDQDYSRMTVGELFQLAQQRQAELGESAESDRREADQLELYGRCRQAGIRGIVR